MVGSFPSFGKVTIMAFNISRGKKEEEAAVLYNFCGGLKWTYVAFSIPLEDH